MRRLSDGQKEVIDEANRDAEEAEMAWRRAEQQADDEWNGGFCCPEAELAFSEAFLDAIESNAMAADWTQVTDDEEPW